MKIYYDLFHKPYWWIWITFNGNVIQKKTIAATNERRLYVKKYKSVFILPENVINPVRDGSGTLIIYNLNNANAYASLTESEKKQIDEDNSSLWSQWLHGKTQSQTEFSEFYPVPPSPELLHKFFSAEIAKDILSPPQIRTDYIPLIAVIGIVAIMLIAAMYFVTKEPNTAANLTKSASGFNPMGFFGGK